MPSSPGRIKGRTSEEADENLRRHVRAQGRLDFDRSTVTAVQKAVDERRSGMNESLSPVYDPERVRPFGVRYGSFERFHQ